MNRKALTKFADALANATTIRGTFFNTTGDDETREIGIGDALEALEAAIPEYSEVDPVSETAYLVEYSGIAGEIGVEIEIIN